MKNLFSKSGILIIFLFIFAHTEDIWHPCIGLNNRNILVPNGLAYKNHTLYVSIWGRGTYVSENEGQSWRCYSGDLPREAFITEFVVTESGIYAVIPMSDEIGRDGIFLTTNNAMSWDYLRQCRPDYFFIKDTNAYFLENDTLFMASGSMENWLVIAPLLPVKEIMAMDVVSKYIFAASSYGLYRFTPGDSVWQRLPIPDSVCNVIAAIDTNLFVGTKSGIFHSTNMGDSWELISIEADFTVLTPMENKLLAGARYVKFDTGGVFLYSSDGNAWSGKRIIPYKDEVRAIIIGDTNIFIGTSSDERTSDVYSYPKSLSDSTGKLIMGTSIMPGIDSVLAIANNGDEMLVSSSFLGVCYSNNRGYTWGKPNTAISNARISAFKTVGQTKIAVGSTGFYSSNDGGTNWSYTSVKGKKLVWLSVDGTVLYAVTLGDTPGGKLFRSLDNGLSWDSLPVDVCNMPITVMERAIFAYECGGNFLKSIDSGNTWTTIDCSKADLIGINAALAVGSKLILSTSESRDTTGGFVYKTGKLFQSSDYGNSWEEIEKPGEKLSSIGKFFDCGPYICAITASTGTYREFFISADTCKSWKTLNGIPRKTVFDCAVIADKLFIATEGGLFYQSLVGLVPVPVKDKDNNGEITNYKFTPSIHLKNGICRISYYSMDTRSPQIAVFNLSGKKLPLSFRWTRSPEGVNSISSVESLQNGIYVIKIDDRASGHYCTKVIMAR
ncbi:MAG TPA: hypothetical protein VHP36_03695 [Chitinispirillaceae bacterium]|nr:hypothetical protein [Chitinispirillaceae bacterium]